MSQVVPGQIDTVEVIDQYGNVSTTRLKVIGVAPTAPAATPPAAPAPTPAASPASPAANPKT